MGVGSGSMHGDLTLTTFMWGILICIPPPPENLIPSHANYMQQVLRCREKQSDGSEYKKTLRRPGIRPDPAEGAYSSPANPLVGVEGLAVPSPRTSSPALGPSGLASPTLHSKISSDAVGRSIGCI